MPQCTFSLEKLLHNAVFPVASWKLGLPLTFTFCELYTAEELSLNQKPVMMRASVLFVVLGFFSIPGPQTQPSDTWFSFIWLSEPISSFTGQKQEYFPSLRSLGISLANSCLLFCVPFSYHLPKRFSLYNNCFHNFYHHKLKITYRHRNFSCSLYLFHTQLYMMCLQYM